MERLIERIFAIQNEEEFNNCAMEVFHFQYNHVAVYKEFVDLLNKPLPTHFSQIPFLPIQFFKSRKIIANSKNEQIVFKSSGTGNGERSQHFVADLNIYEQSFLPTFEAFVGDLKQTIILALLPSYVEQGESSLVYMVDRLIKETNHPLSGYYLTDQHALIDAIQKAKDLDKKIILFGVSYALLDLAELKPDLTNVVIIETGGMKGRRKEMTKTELHAALKSGFNVDTVYSEYGMCELLSQAYADEHELFQLPNWMKFSLREVNDPLNSMTNQDKTGVVQIIDLANIYSCAFIETQDLGRNINGKLKLMGRLDHSEIRGCNLLVQ